MANLRKAEENRIRKLFNEWGVPVVKPMTSSRLGCLPMIQNISLGKDIHPKWETKKRIDINVK